MGVERAEKLIGYLTEIRASNRAIHPSHWDCAIFAGRWCEICTGRDLISEWIATYETFESGFEALSKSGVASLFDLAALHLEPISTVAEAQPGDIAVLKLGRDEAFGIVGGAHVYVLAASGDARLPIDIMPFDRVIGVFRP